MPHESIVSVRNLTLRYRDRTAIDDLSFDVPVGNVLAVLGPNGAGKTTLIRTLTTLIRASSGSIQIAGHDAVADPASVRRHIALTGQSSAIDPDLTVTENLIMIGRLYGLAEPQRRGNEIVDRLDLADIGGRRVSELSGGNQRRADLALGLVSSPSVLFLDEPTTGLDPRARSQLWNVVSGLTATGISVILTTQYLEEADRLADKVLLLDAGRAVAIGTPTELKRSLGGHTITMTADSARDVDRTRAIADSQGLLLNEGVELFQLSVATPHPAATGDFLSAFGKAEIALRDIEISRPTLDQVFLSLTTGVNS